MLYEGTNEIQALDLLQRKIAPDGGAALRALIAALPPGDARGDAAAQGLLDAIDALLRADAPPALAAPVVLRATGLVLLARLWSAVPDAASAPRKRATAAVFFQQVLPELDALLAQLAAITRDPRAHAEAQALAAGLPAPC
jgi:hypothetical protein